jgi:inner membrane protein
MDEWSGRRRSGRDPLITKMFFVGFLVLLLLLPIEWIRGIIEERQARHAVVKQELAGTWGGRQILSGPLLAVPYLEHWKTKEGEAKARTCFGYFLPEALRVDGTVDPETRRRGIFEVVLYRVTLHVSGRFARPDFSEWRVPAEDVLWDDAAVSLGIPDLRGVEKEPALRWDREQLMFQPGVGEVDLYGSGMHAAIRNLRDAALGTHEFAFDLALAGSEDLSFVPSGKETEVQLSSSWPDPSFSGAFLPTERAVDARGVRAVWKVSYFGRPYPQRWRRGDTVASSLAQQTTASAFGLRLLDPVDFYRMSDRAVKYATLFVVLTFLGFGLFEILDRRRIHPVPYLLVGLALCLFYLILLSVSEELGFGAAYAIGTLATLALIAGYATKVLGGKRRGAAMAGLLAGLYGYLYVLLQLEDYALLLGTVGLFGILASVMYVTRNLDWYASDLGAAQG